MIDLRPTFETASDSWRKKVEQIIAAMCLASYRQANYTRDGRKYHRHVPYSVPESAKLLIDCLARNDEQEAKALMAHDYDIEKCRDLARI